MSSNNHFADPSLISFAELQKLVWDNDTLPFPRRREIASAINTVAVWFNLPLDMIPASTIFLRNRFKHVHPAHVSVSKRRIQKYVLLSWRLLEQKALRQSLHPT